MDYQRALVAAADGKAVLFMGAGFSLGASSLNNSVFPSGTTLAADLCKDAKVPVTNDLKAASSRYLKVKRPDELIGTLKQTFTAKAIAPFHEEIAAVPWKAIYTTNYDNVLEMGAVARGKKLTPLTLSDEPRRHRDHHESVIHINGYIDRLDEVTLLNEFKLTNTSYLTTQFRESNWSEIFIRHVRSAQAIFFVGYSLYDLDIQEILYADESLREKAFFIQRIGMTEEELQFSELSDFGTILPIGVEQFAKDVSSVDPLALSTDKSLLLVGFEEMRAQSDEKLETRAEDIFSLLLQGKVNTQLLIEQVIHQSANDYVFDRDAQQMAIKEKVAPAWLNYTVIGDLGNGKTTLLRLISAELIKQGYRCFWLNDEAYDCFDEIDAIIDQPEPVVLVFDNYTRKMDLVAHANLKRRGDTIILFSARTLMHKTHQEDLYFKKIRIDLSKTCEIDCNKLSPSELTNLSDYFSKYGLWGEMAALHPERKIRYITHRCNSELHGVLLGLLSSPEIQGRFSSFFNDLKKSRQQTKTVVAVFALNLLNITHPTAHMIAAVTNDSTVFNATFKADPTIKQFFNSDRDIISPKSTALAEFCLKNFPDPVLLVDSLIEICRATRKKAEVTRFYWDTYRDMASFMSVKRMLPDESKRELLIRFYEGLRSIDLERENPLFWLQYAMARMDQPKAGDLEQAEAYLKTALALGRAKKQYTIVDIETQYARLHLERALQTATTADEAYSYFVQGNSLLTQITKHELYKTEPYRPIRNYSGIFERFGSQYSPSQCAGFHASCTTILENIKRLPPRIADESVVITARKILREISLKAEARASTANK
jgi:hypothetical protein